MEARQLLTGALVVGICRPTSHMAFLPFWGLELPKAKGMHAWHVVVVVASRAAICLPCGATKGMHNLWCQHAHMPRRDPSIWYGVFFETHESTYTYM